MIRCKHIVVDGLTPHNAQVLPNSMSREDDRVVDAGCGFGDTAIALTRIVGPIGQVLGPD